MPGQRHTLPRCMRLTSADQFRHVYESRRRVSIGPLTLHGCPNDLGHWRMGLAIGRRVGKAVVRNRLKRLIRTAFRLAQHDLPDAYDLVISARPHVLLSMREYADMLCKAATTLDGKWKRKSAKNLKSPADDAD